MILFIKEELGKHIISDYILFYSQEEHVETLELDFILVLKKAKKKKKGSCSKRLYKKTYTRGKELDFSSKVATCSSWLLNSM